VSLAPGNGNDSGRRRLARTSQLEPDGAEPGCLRHARLADRVPGVRLAAALATCPSGRRPGRRTRLRLSLPSACFRARAFCRLPQLRVGQGMAAPVYLDGDDPRPPAGRSPALRCTGATRPPRNEMRTAIMSLRNLLCLLVG